MALLPNEKLQQRYRIRTVLGRGDYGAVYRAWDEVDGRDVAVKEYLSTDPAVVKRFRREVKELVRLDHAQLPTFVDTFTVPEVGQYLVSEFVPGSSLRDLLDVYGPLPPDLVVDWLSAVAAPLTYLHEKGRLHLNIKPANMRITPRGEVVLVDTGLPGVGVPPGRSGYVSPEQERREPVSVHSDIYSLGAALYTAVTDQIPPDALRRESGVSVLAAARDMNPDVPPYLSLAANRAMSLRPDARYESVADFARALRRPTSGSFAGASLATDPHGRRTEPLSARPAVAAQTPAATGRWDIQRRTIWGLALVFILLVVTVLSFALLQQEELVGGSEEAATATVQSQVIAALTAVAPTATATPLPTLIPTPTPAPIISQTGMRMVYMPGGVFRYGNNDGNPDERPSRLLNMDPYYIDETEVTNGQYKQCVEAGECDPPARDSASYHPAYYNSDEYDDYPVVFVNWYQADTFCRWRETRLPSEAEWERAAGYDPQVLQRTLYPWGDEFVGENLNYCDSNCPRDGRDSLVNDGHQDTAPVNSYADGRSHVGAADMLGNVQEWTADWYDKDYYDAAPQVNPRGPAEGEFKVLRGGSWFSREDELSVTIRGFYDPTVARATLGFRCATNIR